MLDPRRLLVFRTVARAGSFSAAAGELHLTQPSVSRAVAGLEAAIGMPLLLRRRDGLRLTDAGEQLLARAEIVAGQLARAEEDLAALRRAEAGTARLGAFPSAARSLAVDALRDLRRGHPRLRVVLRELGRADALTGVAAGALDVAVVFDLAGEPAPAGDGLESTLLLREPMLAALPREHRLARRRRLRLQELGGEDWIVGAGAGSPRLVERICRRAGIEARSLVEAGNTQALVAAGAGVTLVPGLAVGAARPDVAIVELEEPPRRDVHAVVLGGPRTPATAALTGALRRAAAGYAARKPPTSSK
jgi:DNA-binding transcriptional LysR family regulator